jgi:DNA-binding response OmpR family regulator
MIEKFTLLIADRNRNIRDYLQRELITDGYRVLLACDGRTVLKILEDETPDLLIIDPDIPYANELRLFERLQNADKFIPLLVHALPSGDTIRQPFIQKAAGYVEKDGSNITNLKDTITLVLRKQYPQRF